jgi:hypothetical protein
MAKTNYLETAILNHVLRNVAYTPPTSIFVALFTAVANGETGAVTEVTGGGYARQIITLSAPIDEAGKQTVSNTQEIVWTATTAWGEITHIGIYDQASNLLYYAALGTSKVIEESDQFKFPVGALKISES